MSRHYWSVGCGQRAKFSRSVGAGGGGGGGGGKIAKWVWAKGDIYPFNEGGEGGERGSGQITDNLN